MVLYRNLYKWMCWNGPLLLENDELDLILESSYSLGYSPRCRQHTLAPVSLYSVSLDVVSSM